MFNISIRAKIEVTKSYDTGLVIVGLAPMLGLVVLLLFWGKGAKLHATREMR